MIYTLTTNPAIDMNINTHSPIKSSVVNRCFDPFYSANGKGLNVSYVLKHFGVDSGVLGFFGDFSGKYIVDTFTNKHKIEVLPTWIDGTTRINVFLNDGSDEYNMVNEGPFVSKDAQNELLNLISRLSGMNAAPFDSDSGDKLTNVSDSIDPNDSSIVHNNPRAMTCLSISGSLSTGIEPQYYDKILEICQQKGVDVILDISHAHLKNLLKYKPYLIKPNDSEVNEIFGFKTETEADVLSTMKKLHNMGAKNILLTMGEAGMYFFNGQKLYFASAKPVKVLSSTCAGDSSLAAFLSEIDGHNNSLIANKNNLQLPDTQKLSDDVIKRAMCKACATGANVAESCGIGDLSKVDEYMQDCKFRIFKQL